MAIAALVDERWEVLFFQVVSKFGYHVVQACVSVVLQMPVIWRIGVPSITRNNVRAIFTKAQAGVR